MVACDVTVPRAYLTNWRDFFNRGLNLNPYCDQLLQYIGELTIRINYLLYAEERQMAYNLNSTKTLVKS